MSDISQTEREFRRQTNLGTIAAGGGYLFWGLSVLYYRQIDHVSPLEILAHRALWSLLLTYGFIVGLGRWSKLVAVLRNRRAMGTLCISGFIIGSNWAVFIWAVNSGRILETSLAYFINPLVSVLTGVALLGERIWLAQKIAIALACVGVLYSTFALGFVPWISLFLAFSFAAYGYLKKTLRVDALEGLFVEVLVLTPLGLIYLAWLSGHGGSSFMQGDWFTDLFLALAGPMTTVPLLLFTYGAQRIRLTTLGLLQYLVPTASFTIAVWVYGEPLGQAQLVTFAFIWTGLVIFTFDTWRRDRALKRGIPA